MPISLKTKNESFLLPYLVFLINCVILFVPKFENDTYWLISTGKYILENGFPHQDPFTIHEGLPLIVHQWTSAVMFSWLNSVGPLALYIFCICIYFFIILLVYKLTMLLSEQNALVSFAATLAVQIFLRPYIVLRPQILSLCILALFIYIMELFSRTQDSTYLKCVPILSVILINVHAALWFLLFIFSLPYIVEAIVIGKSGAGDNKTKRLFIAIGVSFIAGILNPYGVRSMFYVFYSYGNLLINNYIDEMKSPDFKMPAGVILFLLLVVLYIIRLRSKELPVLRYALLSLGALFMGLSSKRSLCFFYITAIPVIAYYAKSIRIERKKPNGRLGTVASVLLIIALIFNFIIKTYRDTLSEREYSPQRVVDYLKEKYDIKQLRVFNGFNIGGFLEYNGFKVYTDSRSELFLKKYNGKKDIFEEYIDIKTGKLHYGDIIDEYGINCCIVKKQELLDTYLKEDEEFAFSFTDGYYDVYIEKDFAERNERLE